MTVQVPGSRADQPGIPLDNVSGTHQGGVQSFMLEEVPIFPPPVTAGSGSGPNTAPLPSVPPTAKKTQPIPVQVGALIDTYTRLKDALLRYELVPGVIAQREIDSARGYLEWNIDREIIAGARKNSYGIVHPDDMDQRAELIAKVVAEKMTDPLMASIFDEAVRHVRQVRAQKNLIALEAAMRKKVPLDKEIVADAARWITEPEPFEIAHKADEKVMAKNQFLRLHTAITVAAKNYVSPELLAAVVAKCEDNLIFYKAEKMALDDLQELIGKKNPDANRVILEYRSDRA